MLWSTWSDCCHIQCHLGPCIILLWCNFIENITLSVTVLLSERYAGFFVSSCDSLVAAAVSLTAEKAETGGRSSLTFTVAQRCVNILSLQT